MHDLRVCELIEKTRRHTSRLSSLAKPADDSANRKSPARTATRVPYMLLTVCLPAASSTAYQNHRKCDVCSMQAMQMCNRCGSAYVNPLATVCSAAHTKQSHGCDHEHSSAHCSDTVIYAVYVHNALLAAEYVADAAAQCASMQPFISNTRARARTTSSVTLVQHIVVHQRRGVYHLCNFCQPSVLLGQVSACKAPVRKGGHQRAGPRGVPARRRSVENAPLLHMLHRGARHKENEHGSKLLASGAKDLLRGCHQHGMPVANHVQQVIHERVHVGLNGLPDFIDCHRLGSLRAIGVVVAAG